MSVICFWRPILMSSPLKDMPLALCCPQSLAQNDGTLTYIYGVTHSGKPLSQQSLKYNPDHKWYYYPDMTCDETIAFKQFDYVKGVDD